MTDAKAFINPATSRRARSSNLAGWSSTADSNDNDATTAALSRRRDGCRNPHRLNRGRCPLPRTRPCVAPVSSTTHRQRQGQLCNSPAKNPKHQTSIVVADGKVDDSELRYKEEGDYDGNGDQ